MELGEQTAAGLALCDSKQYRDEQVCVLVVSLRKGGYVKLELCCESRVWLVEFTTIQHRSARIFILFLFPEQPGMSDCKECRGRVTEGEASGWLYRWLYNEKPYEFLRKTLVQIICLFDSEPPVVEFLIVVVPSPGDRSHGHGPSYNLEFGRFHHLPNSLIC
jgi:hypothetical protein